ncbi:MAG: response regulator [SAR324 cluster bacterium]|nr:response regulator [SAR324 cluster bacterium]
MEKILVIDDSATFRNIIAKIFAPLNYEIIFAENGIEGIRQCVNHSPTFMTVDLEMPVLNGATMMKILGMIGLEVPAIFITGDESALVKAAKLPFVTAAIHKSKIKEKLISIGQDLIENSTNRHFSDFKYDLPHREFVHLLGKRERKRVLIVDDARSMRAVMVRQLEKLNLFEVYDAADGREGLLKAMMIKPDLIISDIEMPFVNGIRLAQILYILGHPFPIMFLSASEDARVIRQAKALEGVTHFFQKQDVTKKGAEFVMAIKSQLEMDPKKKEEIKRKYKCIDINKIKDSGEMEIGI